MVDGLFETLTRAIPGIVWISDSQGMVEFNNDRWREFTGMQREAGLGHGWLDAIHPADVAVFYAQIPLNSAGRSEIQAEIRVRRYDGVYHRHVLNARHIGGEKWIGCAIDAHDWLTTETRDAAQSRVLDLVSSGAELREVLAELCRAAEKQLPGAAASILLVDKDVEHFEAGIAPKFPPDMYKDIKALRVDARAGSCGTAVYENRDVISWDIGTDPLWDGWRGPILALGYKACWSRPVFDAAGKVIASFGFYFKDSRQPGSHEQREMDRLRRLASLAIERARILEALRESEEHYRVTVELNPQIPWTADPAGKILSVSSKWAEATGISGEKALGDGWLSSLHPDDVEPTIKKWEHALASGTPLDASYRISLANGSYRWVRARAFPRFDDNGRILRWYGAADDIHDRFVAEQRLQRHAYYDDLTGLPNRRRFVDQLRRSLDTASHPVGLMVLDMDDFKLVNDRHGHRTGDAVLRLFARYLMSVCEPGEQVFRLGGDEFAIITELAFSDDCLMKRGNEIGIGLDVRMRANKKARSCRASVGCALGRSDENADEVFKRADLALYAAKSSGKGSVKLFDPRIRSNATARAEEFEFARLSLREGWVEPYFQPILSLETRRPHSWEALLRIRHPKQGVLPPTTIRSALDDPRLADAIGLRMVECVVDQMARWQQAGVAFQRVSLNMATDNIVNPEFTAALLDRLDRNGLPRWSVKLEITERVLLDELEDVILWKLQDFKDQGISLSLDDFGTGYASLVHLQTLPVDELKIDRSFVSGMRKNDKGKEIVRAMIGLAKTMGLSTVAEGVETEAEAILLTSWGCDYGQGYLFSRPMHPDDVAGFLAEALGGAPRRLSSHRRSAKGATV
ncbi:PAS domain S-box-containing protein/diguanylate cyclase (GGDEF) domain-containing protein [Devosia enhydra]|uniref:PAS domain S-box-containing protein/diguanylate cyclase (GGDEF) domain-containing protein n=1 Tax=Devosia enhydra TaxID=665118 RepID=A0A1K2HZ39_9HYPH|nr:EAL domain-containing protein [Devosia enhydra]SFZ85405.1 PAS domain S-box-containing protein/diguanylate cyclase (GGDEF) domain-containing protein [Devosia enhydra]